MDIIEKLAKNVIDTKYENLPREAVETTRRAILDTLGCLIGGASDCQREVDLIREWGGKEESTVLVYGGRVPVVSAAWVNSIMSSALDFDDGGGIGALHVSAASVPTALAVSEARKGVTGKEFITAITAGADLAVRIGVAGQNFNGFQPVGTIVVFGTAAIAARILGLDIDGMRNALGIAFVRAGGSHQVASDKVLALRMLEGFASRSGIEAAILAQRGFTGVRNVLQGYHGFYRLYSQVEPDLDVLTEQLGKKFESVRLGFKFYPCCGSTHTSVQAALNLVREVDIDPKKIRRVTVHTSEGSHNISGHPLTFKPGDVPQKVEGQFSQPYTVANAILRKSVKLEHFTQRCMQDPEVIELANKVHPVIGTTLERMSALVEVEMKDGRKYSKSAMISEVRTRSTTEEIKEKFRDCVAFAPKSLPEGNAEKIIDMVDHLEEVHDVSELIKLLVKA